MKGPFYHDHFKSCSSLPLSSPSSSSLLLLLSLPSSSLSSPLLSPSSKALHVGAAQVSGPEQNLLEGLDLLVSDPARNFLLPVSVRDLGLGLGLGGSGKEIVGH